MEFTSFDGKKLSLHEWADVKELVGVVQIAHGMNEYAARYDKFAKRLNRLGYVVVAEDHRGHGGTDPDTLGYCAGDMFGDTLKDMASLADAARKKYPGIKYILFGFSYGSFLTQAFVERYARFLDGAIIAGSSRQNGAAVRAGLALSKAACTLKGESKPAEFVNSLVFGGYDKKVGGEPSSWLSVDEENNRRYREDALCTFVCSNNFFRSFFRGLSKLYSKEGAAGLDKSLPLLLISGAEDPVGGEKGVGRLYDFYKKQGVRSVQKHLIPNSRHEFLNEQQNFEEAFSVIAKFLKSVCVRTK